MTFNIISFIIIDILNSLTFGQSKPRLIIDLIVALILYLFKEQIQSNLIYVILIITVFYITVNLILFIITKVASLPNKKQLNNLKTMNNYLLEESTRLKTLYNTKLETWNTVEINIQSLSTLLINNKGKMSLTKKQEKLINQLYLITNIMHLINKNYINNYTFNNLSKGEMRILLHELKRLQTMFKDDNGLTAIFNSLIQNIEGILKHK